jgi:hypothetical protein
MLERIDSIGMQITRIALLTSLAIALASCAHEDPPLIADPASTRETALPWNEQQKWERDGSAQGLNTAGRR